MTRTTPYILPLDRCTRVTVRANGWQVEVPADAPMTDERGRVARWPVMYVAVNGTAHEVNTVQADPARRPWIRFGCAYGDGENSWMRSEP